MTRFGLLALLGLVCLAIGGCKLFGNAPALPKQNNIVLDQLVIYSDFPLPQRHRLLEDLTAQRAALSTKLALPTSDEPIHVYLFSTSEEFKGFMRVQYPSFPDRRAFFIESDTRLMVYAYWGDRVAEDLRHEVAHGYLHSVVPNLPLWLDEGLAEYFEVPRGHRGLNDPHVVELSNGLALGWRPDLRRLEQMQSAAEMTQIDYAEAWAWVHYLLETSPEHLQFLRSYLRGLETDQPREAFSQQLRQMHLDYEKQLVDYIHWLGQSLR